MNTKNPLSLLEAVLFACGEPIEISKLRRDFRWIWPPSGNSFPPMPNGSREATVEWSFCF